MTYELRKVYVLRIGHRPSRDKRITTHVALVARAFGASGFLLADVRDTELEERIKKVCERWGRKDFVIITGVNPIKYINEWKAKGGLVIHLTMYGINLDNVIDNIRSSERDLLIVVGASKVPREYYEISDYNIAIGHQPHSEVSALAIFLDRLYKGAELHFIFPDAKVRIEPSPRGKKVVKVGEELGSRR